jgi:hypothetical protein
VRNRLTPSRLAATLKTSTTAKLVAMNKTMRFMIFLSSIRNTKRAKAALEEDEDS